MEILKDKKVDITYPCNWNYKLILESSHNHKRVIENILGKKPHKIRDSKNSNKGKYKSYNLTLFVNSDDERNFFFEEFKKNKKIKMVL